MGRSVTTKTTAKNARGAAKKTAGAKPAKKIVNSRAGTKNAAVPKKPAGRSATTGSARSSRSTSAE